DEMKLPLLTVILLLSSFAKAEEDFKEYLINCLYFGVLSDVRIAYNVSESIGKNIEVNGIIEALVKNPKTTIDELRGKNRPSCTLLLTISSI
ncbi:MAG: hypothetical protein MHPSP_001062, partial [Paramarteilia canceri]